jgi:hypothetical protein
MMAKHDRVNLNDSSIYPKTFGLGTRLVCCGWFGAGGLAEAVAVQRISKGAGGTGVPASRILLGNWWEARQEISFREVQTGGQMKCNYKKQYGETW